MKKPETSPEAKQTYDDIIIKLQADNPEVVASQMFGMPTLKVLGKGFSGQWGDGFVVKLTSPKREEALSLPDAVLFDPGMGKPMKEWVVIPLSSKNRWVEFGLAACHYVMEKNT